MNNNNVDSEQKQTDIYAQGSCVTSYRENHNVVDSSTQNTRVYVESRLSPLRRTQSLRERSPGNSNSRTNRLRNQNVSGTSYSRNLASDERNRNVTGFSPQPVGTSSLRRSASFREKNQKRSSAIMNTSDQNVNFSLLDVLRDDVQNLPPVGRKNQEEASNQMYEDVRPVLPSRVPITNRFQEIDNGRGYMPIPAVARRFSSGGENVSYVTSYRDNYQDMVGSSENLNVSHNSSNLTAISRINSASQFKEMLRESQRSMFESIGRELNPKRNISSSASLIDLNTNSSLVDRQLVPASSMSRLNETESTTESRTSRVRKRLQRSASDVSSVQNFIEGNLQGNMERNRSVSVIDRAHHDMATLYENTTYTRNQSDRNSRETIIGQTHTLQETTENGFQPLPYREHGGNTIEQTTKEIENSRPVLLTSIPTASIYGENMKEFLQVGKIQSRSPLAKRKLILDEEKLEELFLRCHVCGDVYNKHDKLPKLLPCHHTFCETCLNEIHKVETDHRKNMALTFRSHMPAAVRVACPACRDAVIVTAEELKKLPFDRTVVALLDVVSQSEKCTVTYCSKHTTQPLNFFCETCVLPVCCDCTVLEHNQQEEHCVKNIDETLSKYTPAITTTIDGLDDQYQKLVDEKSAVNAAFTSIQGNSDEITSKLKETFSHFRTAADDRQEELIEIMQQELSEKRDELVALLNTVKSRRRDLNTTKLRLQRASDEKHVEDVHEFIGVLRNKLSVELDVPTDISDGSDTEIIFDDDEQEEVERKIAEFSDVIFEQQSLDTDDMQTK